MSFDAIVIGTGFGGAATACRLAQAGLSLLVLERGGRYESTDFPGLPSASEIADIERWSWQHGGGLWDVRDLGPIVSAQAAGYGGGSLIYANVHLRPPRAAFDGWPGNIGIDALSEHYDLAAWMLDAAPVDAAMGALSSLAKTKAFDAAASKLGRGAATFHPPLAISYVAHENAFGRRMAACNGCGRCWVGCPRSAKNTLDRNYLALLESFATAQIAIRCEARVIHALETGYAVEYRDALADTIEVARAPLVIVAAGVVGTVELLARSRDAARLGPERGLANVNGRLGEGYHSNGDGISFAFETTGQHAAAIGPTITSCSVQEGPHFSMIQDGGGPPELAELLSGFFNAPYLLGRNRHAVGSRSEQKPVDGPRSPPDDRNTSPVLTVTTLRLLREVLPVQLHAAGTRLVQDAISASRPEFERLIDGIIGRLIDRGITSLSGGRIPPGSSLHGWLASRLARLFAQAFGNRDDLVDFAQRMVAQRLGIDELGAAVGFALPRILHGTVRDTQRVAVLLTMGRTPKGGRLDYDPAAKRLTGQLDLKGERTVLQDGELLARDFAVAFGGELRTNPMSLLRKPITVHSQGGCAMAASADGGVTSLEGEVHGHPGLFVADASLFPAAVGVNPSATVLALAERNVLALVRRIKGNPVWPEGDEAAGARQYAGHTHRASRWVHQARQSYAFEPPESVPATVRSRPIGVTFRERLWGFHGPTPNAPTGREQHCALEAAGAPTRRWEVDLEIAVESLEVFLADAQHEATVRGHARIEIGGGAPAQTLDVSGTFRAFVATGRAVEGQGAAARILAYALTARDAEGHEHRLDAFKELSPGLSRFTWRALSVAFATWRRDDIVLAAGVLRLQLDRFAREQLPEMKVTGTEDPARVAWALATFARFFGGSLLENGE